MTKVLILISTFLVSVFLAALLIWALPGEYHLDEAATMSGVQHLDWTRSWDFPDRSLVSLVAENLSATLALQCLSFLFVLGLSFGLSYLVLRFQNISFIIEKILAIGISAPSLFWIPLLVYFFSLKLELFPLRFEPTILGWILPLLALSLRPLCLSTEILLSEWKKAEKQGYFIVARSKGLSRIEVLYSHGLKNALIPYSAQMGGFFVQSLMGSVLVENLFSFPGMGLLFVQSLQNRDLPVVFALTILFTVIMMLVHGMVELFQAWLEPRGNRAQA